MANIPQFLGETDFNTEVVHHDPQKFASLLPTFVVLTVLAISAILFGYTKGEGKVWVSLALSFIQAGVLCYFCMDLRRSDRLTWLSVGAAMFWTIIMFVIILTDFLTRQYWAH
jgi:caa(3)-type oxidase subunit IV